MKGRDLLGRAAWARIFLLQRIGFCLLLQVMAMGQIELFVWYSLFWKFMDVGGYCGFAYQPLLVHARGEKYREKQDGEWQEEKNTKEEEE